MKAQKKRTRKFTAAALRQAAYRDRKRGDELALLHAQPPRDLANRKRWDDPTPEQIDLIKRTIAKGCDDNQLALFLHTCKSHGLDPLRKQIYCVLWPISHHHQEKRKAANGAEIDVWVPGHEMVIITGIDGYRKMAARDHRDYAGSGEGIFTFADKPPKTPAGRSIPESVTVEIFRRGAPPTRATAYWEEFAPRDLTDKRADFWNRMPKNQLEKCAEAKGLRKAFPGLGDVFTDVEVSQRLQDLTPGGRQIVLADGTAPSGKIIEQRWNEKQLPLVEDAPHGHMPGTRSAQMAEETLRKVEEEDEQWKGHASNVVGSSESYSGRKLPTGPISRNKADRTIATEKTLPAAPPEPFLGTVEIDWTGNPPYLRGDLSNLLELIKKHTKAYWDQKENWWRLPPEDHGTIVAMCEQCSYKLVEVKPKPVAGTGGKEKAGSGAKGPSTHAAAPDPILVKGTIERSVAGMAGKIPVRDVTVILLTDKKRKPSFRCFDKALFTFLDKGIGKQSEVFVKQNGKYWNLVGLKQIGSQSFDKDGKTPCVSVNREPGMLNFGGNGK